MVLRGAGSHGLSELNRSFSIVVSPFRHRATARRIAADGLKVSDVFSQLGLELIGLRDSLCPARPLRATGAIRAPGLVSTASRVMHGCGASLTARRPRRHDHQLVRPLLVDRHGRRRCPRGGDGRARRKPSPRCRVELAERGRPGRRGRVT